MRRHIFVQSHGHKMASKSVLWKSHFSKRADEKDGRTDITILIVAFREFFANAPKNYRF
jgi:hypothetical protein